MKNILKKLDTFGWAIAGAAVLAYIIRGSWTTYQAIAVGTGIALVVVASALKFDQIRGRLRRRSARFGINSMVSVLLFTGVLGFANYLGVRHQKRVDLTAEQIYSLSEQSLNVAAQVEEDVRVKAFYPGGDYAPARDLLDLYRLRNGRISFEFVDPDRDPQIAQQYEVSAYGDFQNPMTGEAFRYGTVVLEMGDRSERIEKQSEPLREEDITNALTKLVKGEAKTIVFIEGHGEKRIDETDRSGLDIARNALEKENYTVRTLNLVQEGAVPEDASLLVVAGPSSEPFAEELDMIGEYLDGGGSVLILLDPPPTPGLEDFLKQWSIEVGGNFIVDASGVGRLFGAGPTIPMVASYTNHRITERFNVMTFFPLARSVSPAADAAEGIVVDKLLETNEQSWGETTLDAAEVSFDEGTDMEGPVSLAVVATKDLGEDRKTRLVVYGDSDFASNGYFESQGNGNLFLNTVSWLAEDESFIAIRPKQPEDRRLTLTDAEGRLSLYVSIVLLPLSILVAGTFVWVKRRK